jgi:hypothetical protein
MKKFLTVSAMVALLAGCQTPPQISGNTLTNAVNAVNAAGGGQATDLVSTGILNAQYNLNEAVTVGALSATDPAPGCINQAVAVMGIGGTAAASFTPKITDAISLGSVGYIYLQQVKSLTGGSISLPTNCLALLGQMVLDVQSGLNKGIISAGVTAGLGTVGIPSLPIPLQRAPRQSSSYVMRQPVYADANASLNGR